MCHTKSHPLKPKNSPCHDKVMIRAIVKEAEKRVREALGFDDAEAVSVCQLEKKLSLPAVKECEKSLKPPENTPDDMHKFFNGN